MNVRNFQPVAAVALHGVLLVLFFAGGMHGAERRVKVERAGTNVVLTFPGRLQISSQAQGPYVPVAGSRSRSPQVMPVVDGVSSFWRTVLGDVRSIAAGSSHTLAVRGDGTLWAWGDNSFGAVTQPWPWFPNPISGTNWNNTTR